jgi:hypothetical protein
MKLATLYPDSEFHGYTQFPFTDFGGKSRFQPFKKSMRPLSYFKM